MSGAKRNLEDFLMTIIASDGKDFKRPKVIRNEKGEVSEVLKDEGFYSPFGVTLEIDDEAKLKTDLRTAFAESAPFYPITLTRPFCSSRVLVDEVFKKDYPKAISFMHRVLESVSPHIKKAHLNWIILPQSRTPAVQVGGSYSVGKVVDVNLFKRDLGNVFSALCAWSYGRKHGYEFEKALVDGFQGKTTNAWDELRTQTDVRVYPKGDECSAPICVADIFAFLTDKKLYSARKKLFKNEVESVWSSMSFEVTSFYFNEQNLGSIRWLDETPLRLDDYLARPMTYLLVDREYLAENSTDGEAPTYKDFLTTRGFHELPIINAQEVGGGVKGYQPRDDPKTVRDGDYLIYMGEESRRIAHSYNDALEVSVLSVKELREGLRDKGYKC